MPWLDTIISVMPEKIKERIYGVLFLFFPIVIEFLINNSVCFCLCGLGFFLFIKILKDQFKVLKTDIVSNLKEDATSKECYVEFQFKNGCIYINNVNVDWVPILNNSDLKKFTLSLSLKVIGKSTIFISPNNTPWKELFFKGSLAVIDMWDLQDGIYRIEFK